MKVIYLINSKEYNYHKKLADVFLSVTGGSIIDMGDGSNLGMRYYGIEKMAPDVIITFDLAGHLLRTGNDSLSLNNIYARFAHILFHKPDHYGRSLKVRQNLSMFTFIPNGSSAETARAGYPEVPNIEEFVPISYKPADDKEREKNIENIKRWWDDFKREAML
ncbi:MAG: hypothetical protein IJI51_00525 [Lachnospiraceae bacterium]|nr:hypothetical protein [Lachnospiraceae bacterium]